MMAPHLDRAMPRLLDFALRALSARPPLVVALGDHAGRWRPHLSGARGCHVVELGFDRDPADIVADDLAGRVDLVCALDVLHHVCAPRPWLRAMGSLLRPGGRLLTTVPNAASVDWWWRTLGGDAARRPPGRGALIRDHRRAGFLTLGHGYVGGGGWGFDRGTRCPPAWLRAWRRRLAPSVYYLGARVELTSRRALET
jgi:SAM-dependent methyltransferase